MKDDPAINIPASRADVATVALTLLEFIAAQGELNREPEPIARMARLDDMHNKQKEVFDIVMRLARGEPAQ